jgi:hypothetical protein
MDIDDDSCDQEQIKQGKREGGDALHTNNYNAKVGILL